MFGYSRFRFWKVCSESPANEPSVIESPSRGPVMMYDPEEEQDTPDDPLDPNGGRRPRGDHLGHPPLFSQESYISMFPPFFGSLK